jgi:hypothetical protein
MGDHPRQGVQRCPVCCTCPSASRRSHRERFFAFEESRVWPARSRSGRSSLACEGERSRYRAFSSGTRHMPRTTGGLAQLALHGHACRRGPMSSRAFLGRSRERVRSRLPRETPREGDQPDQPGRWAARASSRRCYTCPPDEPSMLLYPQGVPGEEHDRIRPLAVCAWYSLPNP